MCLGLPGRIVSFDDGSDLGQVDVAGIVREIDLSMLHGAFMPGDYVLIHSGIALERMSVDQALAAETLFANSAHEVVAIPRVLRDAGSENQ